MNKFILYLSGVVVIMLMAFNISIGTINSTASENNLSVQIQKASADSECTEPYVEGYWHILSWTEGFETINGVYCFVRRIYSVFMPMGGGGDCGIPYQQVEDVLIFYN